jgi:hypothetical protein
LKLRAVFALLLVATVCSCASTSVEPTWRSSASPAPGPSSLHLGVSGEGCGQTACAANAEVQVARGQRVLASSAGGSLSTRLPSGTYSISASGAGSSCPSPTLIAIRPNTSVTMVGTCRVTAGAGLPAAAVGIVERIGLFVVTLAVLALAILALSSRPLRRHRATGAAVVGVLCLLLTFIVATGLRGSGTPAASSSPQPSTSRSSPSPQLLPGYLLIADSSRLVLVSPQKQIVWSYQGSLNKGPTFEDAYFSSDYSQIALTLQSRNQIEAISFPGSVLQQTYGPKTGSRALSSPDDAYVLPNGDMQVADLGNCRIARISPAGRVVSMWGAAGMCTHAPPRALGSPDGDEPLPNGDTLVTEIQGSYIDLLSPTGKLLWARQAPIPYPSDAEMLSNGNILVVGYAKPGSVVEMTRSGHVVWHYGPKSGPGELLDPTHATAMPGGYVAVADAGNDRVVIIDKATGRIVWEYGRRGKGGSATGPLDHPSCVEFLPAAEASKLLVLPAAPSPSPESPSAATP